MSASETGQHLLNALSIQKVFPRLSANYSASEHTMICSTCQRLPSFKTTLSDPNVHG